MNSSKEPLQTHRELKFHKEAIDIYEFEDESPTVVKTRNIDKQIPEKKRKLTNKVVKKTEANKKDNAVVSKNNKENTVVSKNTKEKSVVSNSAKGGNAVVGMIAEENAIVDISAGKDSKSVSSFTKKGTARGDNAVVITSTRKDDTVTINSSRRDNVVSINAKKDNFARGNNASASHYIDEETVFDINSKQPVNNKETNAVTAHKTRQSTLSNHSTIPAKKLSGGFHVKSLLKEQTKKDKDVQNIKAKSVVKEICSLMNSEFSCPKTKSFCWQYCRDISVCYTSLPRGKVLTLYTRPTS